MSTTVVQVPPEIVQKWQEIVNIIAEIIHVPSALVMQVEPPDIKVFVSSESHSNPYERDERASLNTGLYCETVMKTRQPLLVPDALLDEDWKSNPDIKLGMISYLGFPVAWPDGEIFGTICVLDRKENAYSELYHKFLQQCRDVLQSDLRSLARNEAYLEEAQRLSQTGSFGWKISTGEIIWSKESFNIFGYDNASLVTLDMIFERAHPEDRAFVRATLDRASKDAKDFDYEYRLLMPDGAIRHVHVVAHAIKDQADQIEFIGAVMDVTKARRVEEQMRQAQADLAHVARVAMLGELTGAIAHEVNQPLSGIVANASTGLLMLAANPPNVAGAHETVRRTLRDANRASEVITRLRTLFRKKQPTTEPLDLNEAAREVIALSLGRLQRDRVILRTEFTDDLPLVMGDRVQLQQVILNLIQNAADAMSGIDDRPRQLVIRTEQGDTGDVSLTVQDAGIGFNAEAAGRLFEAFYTTKSEGMGIGLSISRSIIESHRGRLWATSNDGPGAAFSFSLPQSV